MTLSNKDYLQYVPYDDYLSIDDASEAYETLTSLPFKSKELLGKVISDRISFLKKSIEEISGQIEERQRLKDILNSDIDEKICQTKSALYELDSFGDLCDRRSSLEEQVAALHKEKRNQKLRHWQDTVKLESELRDMKKELLSALRDLEMIKALS